MKLTFDEAIKEHRKMWNWIATNTEMKKEYVTKTDYFRNHPEYKNDIYHECFCCEYTSKLARSLGELDNTINRCRYCPIIWDPDSLDESVLCEDYASPYYDYREMDTWNDWETCSETAREIAELPARERRDYDL